VWTDENRKRPVKEENKKTKEKIANMKEKGKGKEPVSDRKKKKKLVLGSYRSNFLSRESLTASQK
jgi:hypothetical protein